MTEAENQEVITKRLEQAHQEGIDEILKDIPEGASSRLRDFACSFFHRGFTKGAATMAECVLEIDTDSTINPVLDGVNRIEPEGEIVAIIEKKTA
jgi:hypothetical protein